MTGYINKLPEKKTLKMSRSIQVVRKTVKDAGCQIGHGTTVTRIKHKGELTMTGGCIRL
jgi:hypothetical protein